MRCPTTRVLALVMLTGIVAQSPAMADPNYQGMAEILYTKTDALRLVALKAQQIIANKDGDEIVDCAKGVLNLANATLGIVEDDRTIIADILDTTNSYHAQVQASILADFLPSTRKFAVKEGNLASRYGQACTSRQVDALVASATAAFVDLAVGLDQAAGMLKEAGITAQHP